jgi:hypothetical protein
LEVTVLRARNLISLFLATGAVVATSFLLSCGEDSTAPTDDGTSGPRTLTVAIEAATAVPGERITITGIPDDVPAIYARVTLPGQARGGPFGIGFLDLTSDVHELIAPLHPSDPMGGGIVELEFTDGTTVTSNPITLDLGSLTPAPGAFSAVIDDLQLLFDGWLAQNGTTRAALRATAPELLPALDLTLLLTHSFLDHPDNPNTLRAFADGPTPLFDETEVDRDVLDALTAASGMVALLDLKTSFVDTLTAPDLGGEPVPSRDAIHDPSIRLCIDAPTFGIGANDCGKLAEVMAYRAELQRESESAAQQVIDDVESVVFTALGYTRGAAIASGIATSFWAIDNIEGGHRGTYPSQFMNAATDFQLDPSVFPEDFTDPGIWDNFLVTATSDGWRFDDVILEAISKIKGAESAFDPATIDGLIADAATGSGVRDAQNAMQAYARNEIVSEIREALGIEEFSSIEYCPQTWADIDCTGLPYSSAQSPSLEVNNTAKTYEPVSVGTTQLTVSTTAAFGAAQPTAETKVVQTEALEVIIDPFQVTAETSETVGFTVRVTNAINSDVRWWTEGSSPAVFDSDAATATAVTPDTPWNPAIQVHARSLANTGLREGRVESDPRDDIAPIIHGGGLVIVDPPSLCLTPGDPPAQFTAALIPGDIESIEWRIEPAGVGAITADGLYTPPGTSQTDPVAIIATVNGALEGFALVNVSTCTCDWTAAVSGAVSGYRGGGLAGISLNQLNFNDEGGVVFAAIPIELVTGPGTFDTILTYLNDDMGGIWTSGDGEEFPLPVLTVTERDGNETITGRIDGELIRVFGENDIRKINVSLQFKAQWVDVGESLCSE